LVHWHGFAAEKQGGFEATVPAHDESASFGNRDRIAPALVLDDRGEQLDLVRAVPVRIDRIGLQRVRIKQRGMGAVGGNAHPARRLSTWARTLTPPPRVRWNLFFRPTSPANSSTRISPTWSSVSTRARS